MAESRSFFCCSSMNSAVSFWAPMVFSMTPNSVPTGLVIAAWKRGFWRRMPASRVEPERGRPETKCSLVMAVAS